MSQTAASSVAPGPKSKLRIPAVVAAMLIAGCAPRHTRFDIVDHRAGVEPTHYFESFDECYYTTDGLGRIDLVARRLSPPDEETGGEVTQVIHLKGIWRADPGRTFADPTMINATVSYLIVSGGRGAGFEGAGFLSFNEDRWTRTAAGRLELAKLAPKRRFGEGEHLFDRAELQGQFHAVRDPRRVVRILNEMRRLFGPLPRHEPRPEGADLL